MLRTAIFFILLVITSNLVAQENYQIKGKILSDLPKENLKDIPVVLLKFQPESTPPMFPVARSQTNQQGEYLFENIDAQEKDLYLIGALILGNRISSEPIKLGNQKLQTINIEFFESKNQENISLDLNAIQYTNRLLIFHLLEGLIRITEIIQLQNTSNKIVSSKEEPLHIALPKNYQNFTSFQVKEEILTNELQEGVALLTFQVPPDRSELYFEYDLPFTKEYTYLHPSFSQGIIPVNILFDERYLKITAIGKFLEFDKHGRYTIAKISQPTNEGININIRSKILNQEIFWFFGGIFTLLVSCSLLVFSWKWHKKKSML